MLQGPCQLSLRWDNSTRPSADTYLKKENFLLGILHRRTWKRRSLACDVIIYEPCGRFIRGGLGGRPRARGCTPILFLQRPCRGFPRTVSGARGWSFRARERLRAGGRGTTAPAIPLHSVIRRKWLRHSDCQTFEVSGLKLPRRLSMIILDGQIEKISYPVVHPLRNAAEGVEWLKKGGSEANRAAVKTPFDQGSNRPAALICRGPLALQTQFCRCSQNAPSFWTRRRSGKHRQHRSKFHAIGHGVLSSSWANPDSSAVALGD